MRERMSNSSVTWWVRVYDQVASTMDSALAARVEPDFSAPAIVLAKHQHGGRGRSGRIWHSSPGGLCVTYLLQPMVPLQLSRRTLERSEASEGGQNYGGRESCQNRSNLDHPNRASSLAASIQGYSLVVGIAIAEVLEREGASIRLKWPNDILDLAGNKCGGILIEIHRREGEEIMAAVGVGLNIETAPQNVGAASSIRTMMKHPPCAEELAGRIGSCLLSHQQRFCEGGFSSFREAWMKRACWLGDVVSMEHSSGPIEGNFEGVNERGEALIRVGGRVISCISGDMLRAKGK